MYLVTATIPEREEPRRDTEDTWEGRNELPAARSLAQSWLLMGHENVTIWERVAICELETKMVFKETNGRPAQPVII